MSRGQRIGALAIAGAIAVAAFVFLGPAGEEPKNASEKRTKPAGSGGKPSSPRPTAEEPSYATIELRDGEPVGGPGEISFEKGDTARIEVRSNTAGEVHVHGYDKYVQLKAGKPARTRFRADLEGIFEVEDHDTGTQIAELRVEP